MTKKKLFERYYFNILMKNIFLNQCGLFITKCEKKMQENKKITKYTINLFLKYKIQKNYI